MWVLLVWVAVAGGIGGVVNALVVDKGFAIPARTVSRKVTIYRPGWIGNVVVGAVAASVSWGLYGPLAAFNIVGTPQAMVSNGRPETIGLALSSLVGAVLVGIAGSRWLTNEVDKSLLKATATAAAEAKSDPSAAARIALASPSEALDIAEAMPGA